MVEEERGENEVDGTETVETTKEVSLTTAEASKLCSRDYEG